MAQTSNGASSEDRDIGGITAAVTAKLVKEIAGMMLEQSEKRQGLAGTQP